MEERLNFVFVHGGHQAGWVWDECITALRLQGGPRVGATLALDAPGCGSKQGRNTEGLGIAEVVQEFLDDIQEAGIRKSILVGHSQAGSVMPMMIQQRPELFCRAVYVSAGAPLPGRSIAQMIGRSLRGTVEDEVGYPMDPDTVSVADRLATLFFNDMTDDQVRAFTAKFGKDHWPANTYTDPVVNYDGLDNVPATYVLCLQDFALPLHWQQTFADRLGAKRLARIDAGHQVMNTRPHALAEILLVEAELGQNT